MIASDAARAALASDDALAFRLRFMAVRQGRDPKVVLDRQVTLGQMTRKHADKVLALYERSYIEFVTEDGRPDWAAVADDVALSRRVFR